MKSDALPPGPTISPLAQIDRYVKAPAEFLDSCAAEYGDVFTLRLGFLRPFILIADPALIKEVLLDRDKSFVAGAGNRSTMLHLPMGENFLMAMDGAAHRAMQKILRGLMQQPRLGLADFIRQKAREATNTWTSGSCVSLRDEMQLLALDIMVGLIFGEIGAKRRKAIVVSAKRMLDTTVRGLDPSIPGAMIAFWHQRENLYTLFRHEIDLCRRHHDYDRQDILSALMIAHPEHTGARLSTKELLENLLSLTVAGHDSSAATLAWALDFVLRDPSVQHWIAPELDSLATTEHLTPDDLASTPRLDAVVNETFRLRPVTMNINRLVAKTTQLGKWHLPADVVVAPNIYRVHRHKLFGPRVDDFIPQRFIDFAPGAESFLPFGGGARRCIGESLGRLEVKLILATVLSSAKLSLRDYAPPVIGRRGFVVAPRSHVNAFVGS